MKDQQSMKPKQGKTLVSILARRGSGVIAMVMTSWLWAGPVSLRAAERLLPVTLKQMPDQRQASGLGGPIESGRTVLRGVTVADIHAAARRQFNLSASLKGALVAEVEPDSAAFAAGLRQGDVIQEINRQSVRKAADAMNATRNLLSPRVLVRVWSRGVSHYVVVDETKDK